jgi:hypothetical protein
MVRGGESRNLARPDRGERLFVCVFGDFLRGIGVDRAERRVMGGTDKEG